jgi:hypothetical protein
MALDPLGVLLAVVAQLTSFRFRLLIGFVLALNMIEQLRTKPRIELFLGMVPHTEFSDEIDSICPPDADVADRLSGSPE